ncbi:MAG: molybdopterin cofactor-binding domain-containing protein [Gemmatimonadales bacterium]
MRTVSRRTFLGSVVATGATLTLAFAIPASIHRRRRLDAGRRAGEFAPNLWIRIDAAGDVRIRVHKCEMGQGVLTALAMLIADELEADWSRVGVEQADADFRFADQNTAGSSSIIDTWVPLRRAGAAARLVLVRAAARSWEVPEAECSARDGRVIHRPTGRRISFGELVPLARQIPPPCPEEIRLKSPEDWRLIGKPVGAVDVSAKVTGRQVYGLDVRVPGMLYATVVRCPVIGGSPLRIDDRAARAVPGVRGTFALDAVPGSRLPARVAVVAASTWAALEGRRRLLVEWAEGPYAALSSETIARLLHGAASAAPIVARNDGDAIGAGALGLEAVHATYELPYLAHAPMEPINCTADAGADAIEIWAPTQFPQRAVEHVSALTGLQPSAVRLHVVPMGGGFGRRAYPDFVVEAVQVSWAAGAPVQTVWTREDDMRQDYFRPAGVQRLSAAIDARGRPTAWLHRLAGPSVNLHVFGKTRPVEENEIDGAATLPYSIPHVRVEYRPVDVPVPLGVWRSVAQSQSVACGETVQLPGLQGLSDQVRRLLPF